MHNWRSMEREPQLLDLLQSQSRMSSRHSSTRLLVSKSQLVNRNNISQPDSETHSEPRNNHSPSSSHVIARSTRFSSEKSKIIWLKPSSPSQSHTTLMKINGNWRSPNSTRFRITPTTSRIPQPQNKPSLIPQLPRSWLTVLLLPQSSTESPDSVPQLTKPNVNLSEEKITNLTSSSNSVNRIRPSNPRLTPTNSEFNWMTSSSNKKTSHVSSFSRPQLPLLIHGSWEQLSSKMSMPISTMIHTPFNSPMSDHSPLMHQPLITPGVQSSSLLEPSWLSSHSLSCYLSLSQSPMSHNQSSNNNNKSNNKPSHNKANSLLNHKELLFINNNQSPTLSTNQLLPNHQPDIFHKDSKTLSDNNNDDYQ